jgi:predicted Zn-dependent protease
VQASEPYKRESIVQAFVSIEMIAAILCMAFFWFTIVSYDADSVATNTKSEQQSGVDIMAQVNSLKPMQLALAGQLPEALRESDVLVKKKPNDAAANVCHGNVLIMSNDVENGFRYLKKGIALSHRDPDVVQNYARKLVQAKRMDEAVAQYEQLVKMQPRAQGPHTELAQLYLSLDRPEDAAGELGAVCDINPNNFAARMLRGISLARAGKLKPGLEEYMLGVAQQGQSGPPDALRSMLGNSGAGAMDRVIYELEQQVNNNPTQYVPKLRLAQLYTYGGNPKAAKDLLLDARRLAPQNPEVQRTLAVVMKQLGEDNQAMSAFGLSVKLEQQAQKEKGESGVPAIPQSSQ